MAAGFVVVMGVMTADVCDANPAHQIGQGTVGLGAQDQMPVVWHKTVGQQLGRIPLQSCTGVDLLVGMAAVGQQLGRTPLQCFAQELFERGVVTLLVKWQSA